MFEPDLDLKNYSFAKSFLFLKKLSMCLKKKIMCFLTMYKIQVYIFFVYLSKVSYSISRERNTKILWLNTNNNYNDWYWLHWINSKNCSSGICVMDFSFSYFGIFLMDKMSKKIQMYANQLSGFNGERKRPSIG